MPQEFETGQDGEDMGGELLSNDEALSDLLAHLSHPPTENVSESVAEDSALLQTRQQQAPFAPSEPSKNDTQDGLPKLETFLDDAGRTPITSGDVFRDDSIKGGDGVDFAQTLITEARALDADYCPFCSVERRKGDKFCYACAAPLLASLLDFCRGCKYPLVPEAYFCYHCGLRVEVVPQLRLNMADGDVHFAIQATKETYIVGRNVPEQSNYVDIDLGPYGHRKVSRKHARFSLREDGWYLEDLGSKAGTRIFNHRLQPFDPVPLEPSMVIYFADLKFKLEIG